MVNWSRVLVDLLVDLDLKIFIREKIPRMSSCSPKSENTTLDKYPADRRR